MFTTPIKLLRVQFDTRRKICTIVRASGKNEETGTSWSNQPRMRALMGNPAYGYTSYITVSRTLGWVSTRRFTYPNPVKD